MATIRKRSNRWQVQIRRRGRLNISRSFTRKGEAEAWSREMEIEADRGFLQFDARILQRIGLGDLIERYMDEISPHKSWPQNELIFLRKFQCEAIARQNLAQIQSRDFAKYRDAKLINISGSSVRRNLSIIQHVYEIAIKEWGLPIRENPVKLIRKPKNNPARERRLRPGEYESLLQSANQCLNKFIKPIIIIAVETAMRRGEILAIERGHILQEGKHLRIPRTKTGVPRTIPLSNRAAEILTSRLMVDGQEEDRIFPITANAFRLAWDRVKNRAGIKDLHFHDLRHEAISRLFEQGLGVAHVAAISGHKDFRMLARYTHLNMADERLG